MRSVRFRSHLAAFAVFATLVAATLAQSPIWEPAPSMSLARGFAAGDVIDGRFYVVGGQPPEGFSTTTLEIFDSVTNQWTAGPPAPLSRAIANAVAVDGRLYVIGGCLDANCGATTGAVEIFDPWTSTWSGGPAVPTPREGTAAGLIDGHIYLVGGTPASNVYQFSVGTLEILNTTTGTWTTGATMPTPRENGVGAVVDGRLYVFGGYARAVGAYVNTVSVYDPATDAWSPAPDMPVANGLSVTFTVGQSIYVCGGTTNIVQSDECHIFDTTTSLWIAGPTLPHRVSAAVGANIDKRLIFAGGIDADAGISAAAWSLQVETPVSYVFGGFRQPLLPPVTSFKSGSTIPVKFTLTDVGGALVSTAVAHVSVNGGPSLGTATWNGEQYHFNLKTKGLPPGALTIIVMTDDGMTHNVTVTLK